MSGVPELMLAKGHCEVWSVSLREARAEGGGLEALLHPAERERAAAFLLPRPRRQFVVARAALRLLLGRRLGRPPSSFGFRTNPHGKPSLQDECGLRFNVSHAGELVLIALAEGMEVGVDVEAHHRAGDVSALAESILCPEDLAQWRAASPEEGKAAFFRVWTCKEAVAKGLGCGLAMDFRSLRISLAPGRAPTLVALDARWGDAAEWSLRELPAPAGYSAALAAATETLQVSRHRLTL